MIVKPNEIKDDILIQVINLVLEGEQISHARLKENLLKAEWIAYTIDDGIVKTTATLKNPLKSYRDRVYRESQSGKVAIDQRELGYIATHKDFEGQKYCSKLLKEISPLITTENLFATTRKASMIHILKKHGFKICGKPYKKDLNLMINHG